MGANANEIYQKASLESTVSDFTGFTTREVTKNNQINAQSECTKNCHQNLNRDTFW